MAHHDFRRSFPSGIGTEVGIEVTTSDHISVTDIDGDAQIVVSIGAAVSLAHALLDAVDLLRGN